MELQPQVDGECSHIKVGRRRHPGCGSCVRHLSEPKTATTSPTGRVVARNNQTQSAVDVNRQDEPHINTLAAPMRLRRSRQRKLTIVALGPQHADGEPPGNAAPPSSRRDTSSHLTSSESPLLNKRAASSSCSQCTKAFCLSRGIDFCRNAKDEDVQTMCFQRDSNKDRVIVWGFLLGTSGLLGWAVFKRANELREGKRAADAAAASGRGDYSQLSPARPG
ncbi:hypothetical protein CSAL01_12996 [Colletotrichum salicis]|uniref:Uncharacterized protein n=1 Tax=Colletotrichum salicis TaxID=1209931 RepID=A0A135UFW3_9PEZI|nr:hypothetical protein CSAL01_12996 [Colletotrichum salicis]